MNKPLTCGMENIDAWRIGEVCIAAAASPEQRVGDPIDRGLILRRLLEEKGYGIVKLSASIPAPEEVTDGERLKELETALKRVQAILRVMPDAGDSPRNAAFDKWKLYTDANNIIAEAIAQRTNGGKP